MNPYILQVHNIKERNMKAFMIFSIPIVLCIALFFSSSGCEGGHSLLDDTTLKVQMKVDASWIDLPNIEKGGFIARGEGMSGARSITVNIPVPVPGTPSGTPFLLDASDIVGMNVAVMNCMGEEVMFDDDDIQDAVYVILFEYEWSDLGKYTFIVNNKYLTLME